MRCEYCDVEVTQYPDKGICVCCGGRLPPRPAVTPAQPVYAPVQTEYRPVQQKVPFVPGINCCPKCHNTRLVFEKRGFSWGIGILGFFFVPVFGILLGFCGSRSPRIRCTNCSHKWKRN